MPLIRYSNCPIPSIFAYLQENEHQKYLQFLNIYFYYICIDALPVSLCGITGVESPGTGAKVDYELPCIYWELNLEPLEEQPVILSAELFLHLHKTKKLVSTTACHQFFYNQTFYKRWLRHLLNSFVYFHVFEMHLSPP